ncbi:MAG: riboflavin biosynthesis protein RibF [Bdellovibrionales bacterium RIFCSPHIGHO2_01_FULL_40_29]|nr:MAG: riboflavin biosynthesis protein RibF [Bdellovibrionales bacterium RIFCSPHIGHO2_01_FULL_40_29]OFZ32736.1 MAG: riboflavin biosynthesis protein RibF [Bdellovibrionales bacterium RIFCSPHIGHO2_02_FULL_40_15]
MEWIHTQEQALPHIDSSVLTIGNFDGVHLGHQRLLSIMVKTARELNTKSVVCTFKPHPRTILMPSEPVHRLFDYKDQAEMMENLGVDYLIEEKFSKDLSLMSAESYLESYIDRFYHPKHLVVGYDFNFGNKRSGNTDFLQEFCHRKKWGLTVVPAFEKDGLIVSSSQIRKMLEHGDLKKAEEFLGRPYYLRGPVRVGYKRGRVIGVPTANLSPEIEFIPRKGVYFTKVNYKNQIYPSITNIGFNPTFENKDPYLKVETHLFNFNQDIYGEHISVELCHFHRDEIKFTSVESLKTQIFKDIELAQKFFGLST